MILRIIPLTLFLLSAFIGAAQMPKGVKIEGTLSTNQLNASSVCPPGANPSAGNTDQILFPSAQSNDILYLCFGDSMIIDNTGPIDLSGDPQPGTTPGITYAFFSCSPSLASTDLAGLVADPCLLLDPDPSPDVFYSVQDLILPNGDATFFNQGGFQNFFNMDNPIELWFASITVDDFGAFSYEDDGVGGQAGPCLNISDPFSIVFLNEIQATNLNNNAGGNGCTGTMDITGGLPQVDNSNYNVSIELASDPTVTGTFPGQTTHGETLKFNVPRPGLYNVNITDDKGCGIVVSMDMSGCTPVTFNIPDVNANPGDNICLSVTVEDYTDIESIQFTMEWDPTVIQFDALNGVGLSPPFFLSNLFAPGVLTVNWVIFPIPVPITLADGETAFDICFDVIGGLGTSSPVSITGSLTSIEAATVGTDNQVGVIVNNGSVNILSGNIALDFTSCSTTQMASIGSFTITPTGGAEPYNYVWEEVGMPGNTGNGVIPSNGETITVSPLGPGDYSVTVTDNGADLQVGVVTIADAVPVFVQTTPMNPSCSTSSDASMSIALIDGGVPPYTNEWSTSQINVNMISGLSAGSYTVTVTDNNGCTSIGLENLGTPAVVLDTFSLNHVTCPGGGSDGAITVVTTGGTVVTDYNYIWSTTDTGPTISNLAPGNYCVTVTDDNMCSDVMCLDVSAPILPSFVQFDSTSVSCPNDTNGELMVTFMEGSAPISNYQWSVPGGVGNTLGGISAGTYTVTVTADDGCTAEASATLFAPAEIMVTDIIETPPSCPGATNGQIQVLVSGGALNNNFLWEDGSTQQVRFALACGMDYFVTISDPNNCDVIFETIFLDCPPEIVNTFSNIQDASCFSGGMDDGQATAIPSGGTAGTTIYDFQWSSGEGMSGVMQHTAMGLSRGVNTVTIGDGQCTIIDTIIIGSPPALSSDINQIQNIQPSCLGDSDGSVTIGGTGGTPPYTYQWVNPFVSGATLNNIPAGTYNAIITDFNGCTHSTSTALLEPDLFEVLVDSLQVGLIGCNGDATGAIPTFTQGGNVGLVSYQWNDGTTNSTATGLVTGDYSVTATDIKGCESITNYTLVEPDPIVVEIGDILPPACFGFQTVVILDTVYGGTEGQYQYSVDFGPRRPIAFPIPILGGREHTVTVFDEAGCTQEETFFIGQPDEVVVQFENDVIEIQLGDSAILNPFTGVNFSLDSVVWAASNPALNAQVNCLDRDTTCVEVSVMPTETTLYTLTVFDGDGCSGSGQVTVDVDRNRNVYIPNVFSPNGDGPNDIFNVYIGPGVEIINSMRVFDRWGEILFDSRIPFLPDDQGLQGWDGTLNGKPMNPGVYIYLIEVKFVDGVVLLYRGDVTLLR